MDDLYEYDIFIPLGCDVSVCERCKHGLLYRAWDQNIRRYDPLCAASPTAPKKLRGINYLDGFTHEIHYFQLCATMNPDGKCEKYEAKEGE